MSGRKPEAHLFHEGGGMVTRTHDVATARRMLVDAWLWEHGDPADRYDVAEASSLFRVRDARCETGRIVPVGPSTFENEYDPHTWLWRSGYPLGKPGVTRAVVWS